MTPNPRPPLKVGNRVSVKGYTSAGTYCVNAYGVVHRVLQLRADRIEVKLKSGSIEMVHERQCVRLIPRKPKPAPDAGKASEGRPTVWLHPMTHATIEMMAHKRDMPGIVEARTCRTHEFMVPYRYVQEGHAVVSREALAKAWDDHVRYPHMSLPADNEKRFSLFCAALGLGQKEGWSK